MVQLIVYCCASESPYILVFEHAVLCLPCRSLPIVRFPIMCVLYKIVPPYVYLARSLARINSLRSVQQQQQQRQQQQAQQAQQALLKPTSVRPSFSCLHTVSKRLICGWVCGLSRAAADLLLEDIRPFSVAAVGSAFVAVVVVVVVVVVVSPFFILFANMLFTCWCVCSGSAVS